MSDKITILEQGAWIDNCDFAFQCPKTWESLLKTDDPSIRVCLTCNTPVFLCLTENEFRENRLRQRCVAVNSTRVSAILLGVPQQSYANDE